MHRWLRHGSILACALVLAGCGGAASPQRTAKPQSSRVERMKAIVRAWSNDLNSGDNVALATLFRLPATMIQDGFAFRLTTAKEVAAWNASLPCSGRVVSIEVTGRFATAVFRLGNRKTSKCDAPGTIAAARFTIVGGKITVWRQVPPPNEGPVA